MHMHSSFANSNKRWECIHTHNALYLHSEMQFCLTKSGNTERGCNREESRRHHAE